MSDDILKQLVLGDDLANEIGDFDFANLGFSLADFEVDEENKRGSKKAEKRCEKADEHQKYKNRLGKKKQQNSKEQLLTVSNLIQPENENLENSSDEIFEDDKNLENKIDKAFNFQKENKLNLDNKIKAAENYGNFSFLPPRKIPTEKDLDLQLICVHDGEKIYKLSDLFVPKDVKIIKKIERYNNKIMSISEKEKYEKENDGQKKEVNETEEIKQIIKKAKRNQKFNKINITYDEKFFDRTHFLENIHASTLAHQEIVLRENKELVKKQILQEGLLKSFGIANEKKIGDEIVESNLLNALFYIKVKLSNLENNSKCNKLKKQEENFVLENEEAATEEFSNFKFFDGINFDYTLNNDYDKLCDLNAFDYAAAQQQNGDLNNELNKKAKEDRSDLLSYKNTNFSEFSFSQIASEKKKKLNKNLFSQTVLIDPNDYDEVIKIESKNDNNFNKQSKIGFQTTFFNEPSKQTEAFMLSRKEKALNAICVEAKKSLGKSEKISFEEAEILKLNLLIKENVEKNMKFNPEDLEHDKYLIEDSNVYNHNNKNENSTLDYNHNLKKINNFSNNNNNNSNLKDKNNLNLQSSENDLGEESHNNLMDLDYLNQSNNFNTNSNLKMEMDFENLNNFSFQNNKKLNFTNSQNIKNLKNIISDNNRNSILSNNSSLNTNSNNNINKITSFSNFNSINKQQNADSNPESIVNINKINTFNSNLISKDSEAKNSMFNISNNKSEIKNSAKKNFFRKKSKYSNLSNEEDFNQENGDYENYNEENSDDENEEQEENEENSDNDEYEKEKLIPEDIFETKEFKIFNLHESALLKSTLENNNKNLNNNEEEEKEEKINNIFPKAQEADNLFDLNNLAAADKMLDFKFNKPFPNITKEKTFLLAQSDEAMQSRKPLKSLNLNSNNELNTQNEQQNLFSPVNNLNNLIDLRDSQIKKQSTINTNNKQSEILFKQQQIFEKQEKEFLGIKKQRDIADNFDLYNNSKCKKHKKQAFYNEFFLTGEYLPAIILSEEDLNNPKHKYFEVSKKIFDLNDFNMNFEVLKAENSLSNSNKLNKEKDKETNKEGAEGKEPEGRKEFSAANAVAIDLGTGLPQTKAEISLRNAELITEPLPILPLNEEVSKQNLIILGLNSTSSAAAAEAANLNIDFGSKAEVAKESIINNNLINNHNNYNYNYYNAASANGNLNNININNNFNNINGNLVNAAASPEDFFNSLQSKLNLNSNSALSQNFLKIGKAKGNLLTHAKCSYNLTYNKINLTYDDLRDFHRPNFCKFLLREKKKKNFSFLISEKYNISKGDRLKRWDCAILTRNFLKKQEKKRISKNIQYMNAYEIFKDRHKLSLNDGKYALVEHIDEFPLFVSNFGMASKLKKFLYTPKLFNVNVANPNTKLSDVELKTYNVTGPYGSQILLQPNQKLPLVGQIDLNELKGMSVLDNKMFRAPVFYEKVKNPVLLKPPKGFGGVNDNNDENDCEKENKISKDIVEEGCNKNNNNVSGNEANKNIISIQEKIKSSSNIKNNNSVNNINLDAENSTQLNSHTHHTRRRNVLSLNLNNNNNNSSNVAHNKKIKNQNIEKDTNNFPNTNLNNQNACGSPQAKLPITTSPINIGNNITIDPSTIQVTEGKDGKKYFNFLLTFRKSKEGKESFTIRELEHAYTVAQEEPKIEVYPPQSRQYNNFLKKKIQTYTYKLYDEIGYKRGINFKEFTNLFPNVTEQILKKNFREMNIEIDKNICFFSKIPSEDNHMLITPENICQFESCQFGIFKLREVGIKNITNPDKISYATNKFINQTPDPKQQFLARVTEEELLTTPWNVTQNFLQAKQIKGMLAIKGIGDPSNGQGGYSFLKMPVKNYNDNKTLKEEIDILKNANKNIKTVTGTDADLRKLSKDDIKMKLIQLGQDEEIINKLSRWERVSLLRYRSSQAAQMGYEGDITKYARGTRMNSKLQRDTYQKNINEVFKKQIQNITGDNQDNYYSDSDESEDENLFENNYYNQTIDLDEEDPKKGLNFMKNEIYSNPNNKKKKRPEPKRNGITSEHSAKKQNEEKIIKLYKKANEEMPIGDANTKIKLDFKNIDIQFLNRKKKSSSNMGDIYEYDLDKTTSLLSRKRRDTPERSFNESIEDIVDSLIKFDNTKIFHNPVKKKDYKDYYELIKNPIDLSSIKNKTKRNEYKFSQQFLDDLDLLVANSRTYNGEEHEVTLQAQRIKDFAFQRVEENKDKITQLENQLHHKEE